MHPLRHRKKTVNKKIKIRVQKLANRSNSWNPKLRRRKLIPWLLSWA